MTLNPDNLLAEVAAGVQSESDADVLAEAADILTTEQSRARLEDRLPRAPGVVTLFLRGGSTVVGSVTGIGDQLAAVTSATGERHCVALASINSMRGLAGGLRAELPATAHQIPQMRDLSWGSFLRGDPGLKARVFLKDGSVLDGLPALVGSDHLDLLIDDGMVVTCPFSAVDQVRRP
jgi:hypothetical protein